jgi:hypothetical protein
LGKSYTSKNQTRLGEVKTRVIGADASDADGSIATIEFFNGATDGDRRAGTLLLQLDQCPNKQLHRHGHAIENLGTVTTAPAINITVVAKAALDISVISNRRFESVDQFKPPITVENSLFTA